MISTGYRDYYPPEVFGMCGLRGTPREPAHPTVDVFMLAKSDRRRQIPAHCVVAAMRGPAESTAQ